MSGENINGEELAIIINRGFQTLTDTMNQRFEGVETRLGNVETRLDRVEIRLDRVEEKVETLETTIRRIDERTQRQIDAQYERTSRIEKHLGLSPAPAKA